MAKQKPDDAVGLNIGRSANSAAAWLNQQKEKRAEETTLAPVSVIPPTETETTPVMANSEPKTEKPPKQNEARNLSQPRIAKKPSIVTGKNPPLLVESKSAEADEKAYWEQFLNARSFERPTKNLLITERVHGMISMIARVASAEHKRRMNLNEVLEVIVLSHVEENKPVLAKIQEKWKNRQEWL